MKKNKEASASARTPGGKNGLLLALVLIATGLVLLIWPDAAMNVAVMVLGGALVVLGVALGIMWLMGGKQTTPNYMNLTGAILSLGAGVATILAREAVAEIAPIVIGAALVVNGIVSLAKCLDMKRRGLSRWNVSLALAIVALLMAALPILFPVIGKDLPVVLLGVVLLVNGLAQMWIALHYRRAQRLEAKAVEKAVEQALEKPLEKPRAKDADKAEEEEAE